MIVPDAKKELFSPPCLKRGDTVGVISPSAGLANLFPHRMEAAIRMLERMGYNVLLSRHCNERLGWVSASVSDRVSDIHTMFGDPAVNAIICSIGGNHANQLLKHLDYELIKRNPKIFIGYSDITVLHSALAAKSNLRTFFGPCLISEFGEYPAILQYTQQYFEKALNDGKPLGSISSPLTWSDEFLDWFKKEDLKRSRTLLPHAGYEWWREGYAEGPIWGGTVPSINHLMGTEYWYCPEDSIFFLDIPEGHPGSSFPQSDLDAYLCDLDNVGLFSQIKGLVIGRPYGYDEEKQNILHSMVMNYVGRYDYPILYNAAIGHTAPIITIPLGARTILNSSDNNFCITEGGVTKTLPN